MPVASSAHNYEPEHGHNDHQRLFVGELGELAQTQTEAEQQKARAARREDRERKAALKAAA